MQKKKENKKSTQKIKAAFPLVPKHCRVNSFFSTSLYLPWCCCCPPSLSTDKTNTHTQRMYAIPSFLPESISEAAATADTFAHVSFLVVTLPFLPCYRLSICRCWVCLSPACFFAGLSLIPAEMNVSHPTLRTHIPCFHLLSLSHSLM